jgi:hypothetical protein
MEARHRRSLAIAFFVLLGAGFAFVVGQRVGTSLDRHGRSVTVAHDNVSTPDHVSTPAPPVAQK